MDKKKNNLYGTDEKEKTPAGRSRELYESYGRD